MGQVFSYIRFSSEKQEQGDSLERQLALANKYAKEHNLVVNTHTYRDLGVSAARGKNVKHGALGEFLKAVDAGKIPRGSTLLVENFDRMSRLPTMEALAIFQDIVRKGITLVTLNDNRQFSFDSINSDWTQLIVALVQMDQAHKENQKKSVRVKEAWTRKYENRVPTGNAPSWLKINKDRTGYDLIPEKVKVVKLIFKLSAEGKGVYLITKYLNEQGIPKLSSERRTKKKLPAGDKDGWSVPVVTRLLKSPAVIGRLVSEAKGLVLDDYYPAIIKKEVFFATQQRIAERNRAATETEKKIGAGRKGEGVPNLFSGLCYCAWCGAGMRYTRTEVAGIKYQYLSCLNKYNNKGCAAPQLRYESFERRMLMEMFEEWRFEDRDVEADTGNELIVLQQEVADKKAQVQRLLDQIEDTDESLAQMLNERYVKRAQELRDLEAQLQAFEYRSRPTLDGIEAGRVLYEQYKQLKTDDPKAHDLRLKLQDLIRQYIKKIMLSPEVKTLTKSQKQFRVAKYIVKEEMFEYLHFRDFVSGANNYDSLDGAPAEPTGTTLEDYQANYKEIGYGTERVPAELWYEIDPRAEVRKRGRPRKEA